VLAMLIVALGPMVAVQVSAQTFTTLYSFTANSDGTGPGGLILWGNTLCGSAEDGGSFGGGTVFRVKIDGTGFTNLHNFSGREGLLAYTYGGALASSAYTLYGTTYEGGSSPLGLGGAVFAVNIDGTGFMTLHSFYGCSAGSDGCGPFSGLILSENTLYGT